MEKMGDGREEIERMEIEGWRRGCKKDKKKRRDRIEEIGRMER